MITKSKDELIGKLKPTGFTFSEFQLVNEGHYETYDAEWNYKDIPHLNALHKLVNSYPSSIDDNFIAGINRQKVLGFVLPMIVVNYHSGKNGRPTTRLFSTCCSSSRRRGARSGPIKRG